MLTKGAQWTVETSMKTHTTSSTGSPRWCPGHLPVAIGAVKLRTTVTRQLSIMTISALLKKRALKEFQNKPWVIRTTVNEVQCPQSLLCPVDRSQTFCMGSIYPQCCVLFVWGRNKAWCSFICNTCVGFKQTAAVCFLLHCSSLACCFSYAGFPADACCQVVWKGRGSRRAFEANSLLCGHGLQPEV